ncbi:DUF1801 domain-containing protein [Pedobacter sp. AW1-32]|uniref:DUF1801 domain-containing protein n=1 Tax=Pedobacter sp. AW1-32 TaxID=3383026 RepID=UPI003FF0F53A
MAKNKTTENTLSVTDFLNATQPDEKKIDCFALSHLITELTGMQPKMWGTAIVGFGTYHYVYESGHEGDAPLVGFSPRANAISLYLSGNFANREELLKQFGKHKTGKACIYIKKLSDVNLEVLRTMISNAVDHIKNQYG